jgi:HEAT repeat protein
MAGAPFSPRIVSAAPAAALLQEGGDKAAFLAAYQAAGDDKAARAKALELLVPAPESVRLDVLLKTVLPRDNAPVVQAAAVRVFRGLTEPASIKTLAEAAQGKGDWGVRGTAIEALGFLQSSEAVEGLVRILKKGDSMGVAAALCALAQRCPAEVRDEVKVHLDHSAWQVRLGALEYFGGLKDRETVPWRRGRSSATTRRSGARSPPARRSPHRRSPPRSPRATARRWSRRRSPRPTTASPCTRARRCSSWISPCP